MSTALADKANADYSLRVLWPLAKWLEEKRGAAKLDESTQEAGLTRADFSLRTKWVSHGQFERILSGARAAMASDEEFKDACCHRFRDNYGPIRYMVWALTPASLFDAAVKMSKMVTNVSRFQTLESARDRYVVRYSAERAESRLMCLSRQGQWELGPTLWDLPAAQLEERKCIAHGDDCCEYRLRWFARGRVLPLMGGFIVGAIAALLIVWQEKSWIASLTLPILGVAITHMIELSRTARLNAEMNKGMNNVLGTLGEEEAEARTEIMALQERQREWLGMMETQVAERTTALERIVDGMKGREESRVTTLRGFSHDLRNPLFVLRGNTQFLVRNSVRELTDEQLDGIMRDMETATLRIEKMLVDLMEIATTDPAMLRMNPRMIEVAPLVDVFSRRLKALVYGRDLKVSVLVMRGAPSQIEIDPMALDRVADNLLTNAAKYTTRGTIVVELGGTPNGTDAEPCLTLKVADTGEGIDAGLLREVFRPRSASAKRDVNSYGVGLSGVVKLLAQLGGRLEVLSKPGVGTTFWVHIPSRAQTVEVVSDDNIDELIGRVVTVRAAGRHDPASAGHRAPRRM